VPDRHRHKLERLGVTGRYAFETNERRGLLNLVVPSGNTVDVPQVGTVTPEGGFSLFSDVGSIYQVFLDENKPVVVHGARLGNTVTWFYSDTAHLPGLAVAGGWNLDQRRGPASRDVRARQAREDRSRHRPAHAVRFQLWTVMVGRHFGTAIVTAPIATKEEPKVLLHAGRRHGRKAG
jgi:hypothetical protein